MTEKIVYGAIIYQKTILAFHSLFPKINPLIESLLESQIDYTVDQKRSFAANSMTHGFTIQYQVLAEFVYISAATINFPHTICFQFLNKVREDFYQSNFDFNDLAKGKYAAEEMLEKLMTYYSTSDEIGTRYLDKQLSEVTNIMRDNIDIVLKRGEVLTDIDRKSQKLDEAAIQFNKSSKDLKCYAIKQNIKSNLCLILFIFILLTFIAVAIYLAIRFIVLS